MTKTHYLTTGTLPGVLSIGVMLCQLGLVIPSHLLPTF